MKSILERLWQVIFLGGAILIGFINAMTGPVAYYPLDNDAVDYSDNGNNGTIYGPTSVPGILGNALYFNGSSDYIKVPNNGSFSMTNSLTISMWVKPELLNLWYKFISKSNGSETDNDWSFGEAMAGGLCFSVYKGSTQYHTNGQTSLNLNQWNHVVGTWDGNVMQIYQNGILQPDKVFVSAPINSSMGSLFIGKMPQNTYYFKGAIDELMIFNKALSAEEVDSLYKEVYVVFTSKIPKLIPLTPNQTYDRQPILRWHADSIVTTYKIQIAFSPSFSDPLFSVPTPDTFFQPSIKLPFGKYYWRVSDTAYSSSWSIISSFTVLDPAVPVVVPYTPDPTRNRKPILSWNNVDDTTMYTIQIYTGSSWISPFIQIMTVDTFFIPTVDLPIGKIFWSVKSGLSDRYSTPDTFEILSDSVPMLISMKPDTQYTNKPTMKWLSATGASSYRIQIDTVGNFIDPFLSLPISDTSYTPSFGLPRGKIYWRVGAGLTYTQYSGVDTFWVMRSTTTSRPITQMLNKGISIRFNKLKGIDISYSVEKTSAVSLKIFSMAGQRAATVYDGFAAPGTHRTTWYGNNDRGRSSPDGGYILIGRINGKVAAQKIILMR